MYVKPKMEWFMPHGKIRFLFIICSKRIERWLKLTKNAARFCKYFALPRIF